MYGEEFEQELTRHEAQFPEEKKRAALLLSLHSVQAREGYVPEAAIHWLAERYGISSADVQGVISFYTMFFDEHPGKHVIWLCRTFSCELMGGQEIRKAFEEALGCEIGGQDETGTFGLRWQECLAACDKAPCALIDRDMYENLTPESVRIILDHVKSGGGGGRIITKDGGAAELVPLDVPTPGAGKVD
jgi:NADH:ubiquinone oxidoreductase subunit E